LGSYFVLDAIERPQPSAMTVEVTGRQFGWQFYYPSLDVRSPELRVPAGQQVLVKLHSADVIHQFWIPAFRLKKDVMPDRVTEVRFTGRQEGTYPIRCTKICGVGHSAMVSNVVVMKQADFDAWLGAQANPSIAGGGQAADPMAKGREVFLLQGCNSCHALKDANANGSVGPNLNDIGAKAESTIKDPGYTGQAETAEDFIKESIVAPNVYIAPGFPANVMPQDFGKQLSPDDLNALVQYLNAQK
jgi:cytochrome c oxidase subunit 2